MGKVPHLYDSLEFIRDRKIPYICSRETRLAQLTLECNLDMPCRATARECRGSHRAIALDLTLSRAFQLWVLMGVIAGSVKSLDARLSPAKGECANRRGM